MNRKGNIRIIKNLLSSWPAESHICGPLPNIKKNERVIQKKIKTEFKHHITK